MKIVLQFDKQFVEEVLGNDNENLTLTNSDFNELKVALESSEYMAAEIGQFLLDTYAEMQQVVYGEEVQA